MLMLLAFLADGSTADVDQRVARMTALYEQICLKAFPDDASVKGIMAAQGARALTPDEVKVTMRDDPALGWELKDEKTTVWLELPPFHACSVRWSAPMIGDLKGYRAVAEKYESAIGKFRPMAPYDTDYGDIHVHAVGEQRVLPDATAESLFIFDQHVTDPKRREAGETGFSVRFVHQFAPPPPSSGK